MKTTLSCKIDQLPLLRIHSLYKDQLFVLDYCKDQSFVPISFVSIHTLALARQNDVRIHAYLYHSFVLESSIDALSSMPCCLPFTIACSYAQAPKCFQCLIGIPQYMDHLLNLMLLTCGHFP